MGLMGFVTLAEALKSVGNITGKWNWAVVGADESILPLAGGGSGDFEETHDCIVEQLGKVFVGAIRLNFQNGLAVFVFVLATGSNVSSGQKFNPSVSKKSALSGGQAVGNRPV